MRAAMPMTTSASDRPGRMPAQSRRESRLRGKRLRVEVLLAGATAPEPLPVKDLVEADLWDQLPADLVDWRDGWFDGRVAPGRTADVFCEQVRAAVARSTRRGRVAIVIADNLKAHTPAGSLLVRGLRDLR